MGLYRAARDDAVVPVAFARCGEKGTRDCAMSMCATQATHSSQRALSLTALNDPTILHAVALGRGHKTLRSGSDNALAGSKAGAPISTRSRPKRLAAYMAASAT
jgi:hypothetical protein